MRKRVERTEESRSGVLSALGWSRRDALGLAIGGCALLAILVNVLFMQSGPHPAPMFNAGAVKPVMPDRSVAPNTAAAAPVAHPRSVEPAPLPPPAPAKTASASAKPAPAATARMPGDIITDIQRELARRGFFDGAVDGLYGPKTDGAIRDFEQAASLKPSYEPNEALLQAIVHAPARVMKGSARSASAARPVAPLRNDAERPATVGVPAKRVVALQRVLAEFGYGQIKPSGIVDTETEAAIEKFERERRLPITGQPSDRVARELAAVTGRPLE